MNEPGSDPYRTPARPPSERAHALSSPYDGQTHMRLVIASGLCRAHVRVDPSADALITIDPGVGPAPRLRVHGGEARVSWPMSPADWLHALVTGARDELAIVLHPAVAWSIAVRGGVSSLTGDLSRATLGGVEVGGGCSDVELELPKPEGVVPIRISGGASRLRVRRPADVGVSVSVHGGVSSLRLDDRRFEAIGGAARLESAAPVRGADAYEIEVSGGASDVEIA
ncbi:hypothetical protein [Sandaracinus amylolyticus]|uniref:Transcriptional regulatory protein n=1 Tax=Sandaracinus amylolyticus TaxID=927083 RepID=A0A0F6W0C7_9BACT|nr:hypothetical protein [Sandaracinus amylolyticus]AKF04243.1 transcriptional regulatory protein [Sandaracinus amylolyticus]